MTKKKTIIISSILVLVLLALVGIIATFSFKNQIIESPSPPVIATPVPTELTSEEKIKAFEKLMDTKQFEEGSQSEYASYFSNGTLNQLNPPDLTLATWTVSKYVENAITNPYFASGWWEAKDNYRQGSIDTYISPYLSKDLAKSFTSEGLDKAGIEEKFKGKIFFPDSGLQVAPQCFETWEDGTCFAAGPKEIIEDFSFEGLSATSVRINVSVKTSVLYQKPDSAEGNLIAQHRVYNMSFVLSEKNISEIKDSEIPIMIIESIDSSLEIKGTSDYLVNES